MSQAHGWSQAVHTNQSLLYRGSRTTVGDGLVCKNYDCMISTLAQEGIVLEKEKKKQLVQAWEGAGSVWMTGCSLGLEG